MPSSLAGSRDYAHLAGKKSGGKWMKVKSVQRTISASGAYSWVYKTSKIGTYRMRGTIAKTTAHTSAHDAVPHVQGGEEGNGSRLQRVSVTATSVDEVSRCLRKTFEVE